MLADITSTVVCLWPQRGGWHPRSLSNSVQIIRHRYPHSITHAKLAADMLMTLFDWYTRAIDFDAMTDDMSVKYTNGYETAVHLYQIIAAHGARMRDPGIRINAVYTFLFCAQAWCLDCDTLDSVLRISYRLSRFVERHYPFTYERVITNSEQYKQDNPLLGSSSRLSFGYAYRFSMCRYISQIQLTTFTQNQQDEAGLADFILQHDVVRKINVAWDFLHREIHSAYQQYRIAQAAARYNYISEVIFILLLDSRNCV